MAAGRRRRRHLVHAHHVGFDRAAEGRAAARAAPSTASPTGPPRSSSIGPGTVVANYAPLNFDLCLLDIWTTLQARRLRRARRPGPRDQRRLPRRPDHGQRGQRAAGGADALPAADRRGARGRPELPERQARNHDRGQDPAELARGAARPLSRTPASSTSTAARRRTTASSTSSRAWPTATCRRTSRWASRCPASRTLIRTDDGEFLDGTRGPASCSSGRRSRRAAISNAALNEDRFAPHPEAGDGETTYYRLG